MIRPVFLNYLQTSTNENTEQPLISVIYKLSTYKMLKREWIIVIYSCTCTLYPPKGKCAYNRKLIILQTAANYQTAYII